MIKRCPHLKCPLAQSPCPDPGSIIRSGTYFRKSDSKYIPRFYCKNCQKYFSSATFTRTYFQKNRRINPVLRELLTSGVSQRRAAKILGVNPKTVVRRFRFLAQEARLKHEDWRDSEFKNKPLSAIQFDDLETGEHTKCKPLSVCLAIDPKTRKILSFKVSQMPAKGLLAKIALRKYGYRKDQRPEGWNSIMKELIPFVAEDAVFKSDQNPHYPKYLFKHYPKAQHETVKGGRGSISGQGELKKLRFDPIFALNHTCAMLRANLNRLFRRTWCMSKNKQGLIDHLSLYVTYHNLELTA
jgi:transposase-like protein